MEWIVKGLQKGTIYPISIDDTSLIYRDIPSVDYLEYSLVYDQEVFNV